MKLPVSLERRLALTFPRSREREVFVAEAVERALTELVPASTPEPQAPLPSVGGTLHLYTDGGSRGNPGQAAVGCVLLDPARGVVLREQALAIGIETNNVAEYRALIEGLKLAREYHPNRLVCHLDSELVVRQLNGQYQVKVPSLRAFVDEISGLAEHFPDVVFVHVPRAENHRADALVNRALDDVQPSRAGSFHVRR